MKPAAVIAAALIAAALACATAQQPAATPGTVRTVETPDQPRAGGADGLEELTAGNPDFKGARLVAPEDLKNDFDREWFPKMGYSASISDDFENDGQRETAAVLKRGETFTIVLVRKTQETAIVVYREDIHEPAMLRSQEMCGATSARCVLVTTGRKGLRYGICWDGKSFTKVTL